MLILECLPCRLADLKDFKKVNDIYSKCESEESFFFKHIITWFVFLQNYFWIRPTFVRENSTGSHCTFRPNVQNNRHFLFSHESRLNNKSVISFSLCVKLFWNNNDKSRRSLEICILYQWAIIDDSVMWSSFDLRESKVSLLSEATRFPVAFQTFFNSQDEYLQL